MAPDPAGYAALPTSDSQAAEAERANPGAPWSFAAGSWARQLAPSPGRRSFGRYDFGRRFDQSSPWYVLHPNTLGVQVWHGLLTVLLVVQVIYLPLEAAYDRYFFQSARFWFGVVPTVMFSSDIVLNFFLQIPSETGDHWVFNHSKIVRAYLQGGFVWDLISVLPFSEMQGFLGGKGGVWLIHLLRFVKLLRLLRFWRLTQRYMYDVTISLSMAAMLSAAVAVVVSVHFISCLWATMADYQVGENWMAAVAAEKAEAGVLSMYYEGDGAARPVVLYIVSTYFALATLVGLGYGDITPSSVPEVFCCLGIMFVSSVAWAFIRGEIVSLLQRESYEELEYRESTDTLVRMSHEYTISVDLKAKLRGFVKQRRFLARESYTNQRVLRMASSSVAVELVTELHKAWLDNVWWLRSVIRSPFMVQLALAFKPQLFVPKERVDDIHRLFVIRRGLCMHGTTVLLRDQSWNLDFMLLKAHLRRIRTTTAISYLHVIGLKRQDLNATLASFPEERRSIRRAYRYLCLMRGIMYTARKMEAEHRRRQAAVGPAEGCGEPRPGEDEAAAKGAGEAPPPAVTATEEDAGGRLLEEARGRLVRVEEELGSRLGRLDEQLRLALDAVSDAVAARHGRSRSKGLAERGRGLAGRCVAAWPAGSRGKDAAGQPLLRGAL